VASPYGERLMKIGRPVFGKLGVKIWNFNHPEKFLGGGNKGGGWGSSATDLGAKYSLKGKTFPDHPLYFWRAFENCTKFDPNLGSVEVPITGGSRCRPLPNNGDTSPTERSWNGVAAARRLVCLYPPVFALQFSSEKKFFIK